MTRGIARFISQQHVSACYMDKLTIKILIESLPFVSCDKFLFTALRKHCPTFWKMKRWAEVNGLRSVSRNIRKSNGSNRCKSIQIGRLNAGRFKIVDFPPLKKFKCKTQNQVGVHVGSLLLGAETGLTILIIVRMACFGRWVIRSLFCGGTAEPIGEKQKERPLESPLTRKKGEMG